MRDMRASFPAGMFGPARPDSADEIRMVATRIAAIGTYAPVDGQLKQIDNPFGALAMALWEIADNGSEENQDQLICAVHGIPYTGPTKPPEPMEMVVRTD